jgi:O-antigen/teichoic acid export membrane protein
MIETPQFELNEIQKQKMEEEKEKINMRYTSFIIVFVSFSVLLTIGITTLVSRYVHHPLAVIVACLIFASVAFIIAMYIREKDEKTNAYLIAAFSLLAILLIISIIIYLRHPGLSYGYPLFIGIIIFSTIAAGLLIVWVLFKAKKHNREKEFIEKLNIQSEFNQ